MKFSSIILCALCLCSFPARAEPIPFFDSYPEIDTDLWHISSGWANGTYMACEWRTDAISAANQKLRLTLSDRHGKTRDYTCPEIHTNELSGYGVYSARIRSAAGSGLNTAFFTYVGPGNDSPSHDEIDFEFLGKNPHSVQLNYYIQGKPQDEVLIPLAFDASKAFHNYTFVWQRKRIRWYIDGKLVHETKKGVPMPTHPGRIYASLWAGSKEFNNWLGPFNYTKPVSAEFMWIKYTPFQ